MQVLFILFGADKTKKYLPKGINNAVSLQIATPLY
jgi:hypothetical protein